MKTFLIFKSNESGYEAHPFHTYTSEEMEFTTRILPNTCFEPHARHFELPEGMLADEIKLEEVEGVWTVVADPARIAAKAQRAKDAQILGLYNEMNTEILTQMAYVFGTTNTDSAMAYERTWVLMVQKPEKFAGAGLKALFEAGGLNIGDALDTNAKVVAYAQAKTDEVEDYGVWRMQRIEQFRVARDAALIG